MKRYQRFVFQINVIMAVSVHTVNIDVWSKEIAMEVIYVDDDVAESENESARMEIENVFVCEHDVLVLCRDPCPDFVFYPVYVLTIYSETIYPDLFWTISIFSILYLLWISVTFSISPNFYFCPCPCSLFSFFSKIHFPIHLLLASHCECSLRSQDQWAHRLI